MGQLSPVQFSLLVHLCLAVPFLVLSIWPRAEKKEFMEFQVLPSPEEALNDAKKAVSLKAEDLQKRATPLPPPVAKEKRAVFGVNRKAILDGGANENAVEVKSGNTLAKTPDELKLKESDVDDLSDMPPPSDEISVTQMPKLKTEFRVPYPDEAKKKNIQGVVILEVLIDQNGKVRRVKLLKGLGFGLDEAALSAIRKFQFEPAKIGTSPVPVWLRYTYKFVLEK